MIVVVTGATGAAGRAVCARLAVRGDTVIAVGTDADRLATVAANDRRLADLTDVGDASALAREAVDDFDHLDAVLHLVGGWRPGDSAEADAWLRPRLVDSVANVIEAFEPALTASAGRLAIVSSTAVRADGEQTSSYARAKADAEELVAELGDRLGVRGGAATVFVLGSLGDDGTGAAALAEQLTAWLTAPAAEVNGARLRV